MQYFRGNQKSSFTVLELIIVIIVIGVLASLALPRFFKTIDSSRSIEAVNAVGMLKRAADRCAMTVEAMTGAADDYAQCDTFAEIGMENPGLVPGASYSYVLWPYLNTVWKIVATQTKGTDIGSTITFEYCVTGTCPAGVGGGGGGGGGGCFIAGTAITMADNTTKPIEEIKVGDMVLAFDEQTGEMKEDIVSHVFSYDKEDTYLVINNHLRVTPVHGFLSKGEWLNIGDLKVGDTLTNTKGEDVPIERIDVIKETVDIYNFEVNPYHTYVANGLIVHNSLFKTAD